MITTENENYLEARIDALIKENETLTKSLFSAKNEIARLKNLNADNLVAIKLHIEANATRDKLFEIINEMLCEK